MEIGPAVFDRQILSLNIASVGQALVKRFSQPPLDPIIARVCGGRVTREPADHRHRLLLRAEGARCRHRAGQQEYEVAAPHAQPLDLAQSSDYGSTEAISDNA